MARQTGPFLGQSADKLRGPDPPEAILGGGAGDQPVAIRAECDRRAGLVGQELRDGPAALTIPKLNASAVPGAGRHPSAVGADRRERGTRVSQPRPPRDSVLYPQDQAAT